MALITCPECGASVSDKAVACPSCGHPMNPAFRGHVNYRHTGPVLNGRSTHYLLMVIAVIVTILLLFTLLNTCNFKDLGS